MNAPARAEFDPSRVRALTLDLDDTLWPIWPTIERAEQVLAEWLARHAPATAALGADRRALRAVRDELGRSRPDLAHDLSALRRESIRALLQRAGDDPALAEPAFEVFFDERQRVVLFEDALPALERLSARFPIVALSNGNADLRLIGLDDLFSVSLNAIEVGAAKPEPLMFEEVCRLLGTQPNQIVHVGDDPEHDVQGGQNAGFHTVWVNRTGRDWPGGPRADAEIGDLAELEGVLADWETGSA